MFYKYLPCLRLTQQTLGNPRGVGGQSYYTDSLLNSAPLARQSLALPYEPLYRLQVNTPADGWEPFEGRPLEEGATPRRVWAAFGQPGGAFERATKRTFAQVPLLARSPPAPGE